MCMPSRFSDARLFVTPWTIACQAPLSMGFSRQEYWSGLPCPPLGGAPASRKTRQASLKTPQPPSPSSAGTVLGTRSSDAHIFLQSPFCQLCACRALPLWRRCGCFPFDQNGSAPSIRSCVCAKSLQSCPTLCEPVDCSLPGSSVHGISQLRIPSPPPGDFPHPGIQPRILHWQACSLPLKPPWEAPERSY